MSDSGSDAKTRILQAVDIVELIGQTVRLKRLGGRFVGLCPFHQEKTPSFSVNPSRQYFYCFGCKASGNVIDFVIKRDRVEFVEAMQILARLAGIELPKFGVNKQNTSERQVLLEAHSAACGLFEKSLSHPQIGAAAREYLAKRGFTEESIKKFQIGLAPEGWDTLLKNPAMKKFAPHQLALAGLVKARTEGEGFYDTFRNRIMFPIRDEQSRIIAFGGRITPNSEDPAKYLNSPETPLFSKSRTIYGLDMGRQKIVESRTVAVVEGYTDVVMAHQYGATNVVSVLGTAMTEPHVTILRRFADRIVLLFDSDLAGDLAVNRAVELFLTQPVEIAIASMPDGLDPDEYLMQHGLESFQKLLADAQDALNFKWRQLQKQFGAKNDLTSQQKAIEQYLSLLADARGSGPVDSIRWGQVLARVSRLTDIPATELNRRFKTTRVPVRSAAQVAQTTEPIKPVRAIQAITARDRAERWLLGILLAEPGRWADVQRSIQPHDFSDDQRKRVAEIYWEHQRHEGEPVFSDMLGLLNEPVDKDLAVTLLEEVQTLGNMEQMLTDAMAHLAQIRGRADHKKLMSQLPDDEVEVLRKLQERVRQADIRRTAT